MDIPHPIIGSYPVRTGNAVRPLVGPPLRTRARGGTQGGLGCPPRRNGLGRINRGASGGPAHIGDRAIAPCTPHCAPRFSSMPRARPLQASRPRIYGSGPHCVWSLSRAGRNRRCKNGWARPRGAIGVRSPARPNFYAGLRSRRGGLPAAFARPGRRSRLSRWAHRPALAGPGSSDHLAWLHAPLPSRAPPAGSRAL